MGFDSAAWGPRRKLQGERGPDADLAFELDRTGQHLRQPAADREAQPGAAVAARRRAIQLTKVLEDLRLRRQRNADAGVADGDRDGFRALIVDRADRDTAARRELQRVAQEVQHHLLDLL